MVIIGGVDQATVADVAVALGTPATEVFGRLRRPATVSAWLNRDGVLADGHAQRETMTVMIPMVADAEIAEGEAAHEAGRADQIENDGFAALAGVAGGIADVARIVDQVALLGTRLPHVMPDLIPVGSAETHGEVEMLVPAQWWKGHVRD